MKFDIAIIGSGPAGASAALNAKIRKKNIAIFGRKNISDKIQKSEIINNYLGIEKISGEEFAKKIQSHLTQLGIDIIEEFVEGIYDMGTHFSILTRQNKMYDADSVIIASGVSFKKPLKGEIEFLGRGVGYCATCDAALYKGRSAVVVGMNEESIEEANFIAEYTSKTTFVNMTGHGVKLNAGIEVIEDVAVEFVGDTKCKKLVLKNGEIEADGFFVIKDSKEAAQLIDGLEIADRHIVVDKNMQTNIRYVYAAGDITGHPYQINKACGEGQVAGLNASKKRIN